LLERLINDAQKDINNDRDSKRGPLPLHRRRM